MKNLVIAATIALLSSTSAFAAKPPQCNPAIQNWENGSKDTCVYDGGRNIVVKTTELTPAFTPAPTTPGDENLNDTLK